MNIEKLNDLAISETGFIFDPSTGNSYTTNETGLQILNALRKGETPAQTALKLSGEFDISADEAEQDIAGMLELFRSHNLV